MIKNIYCAYDRVAKIHHAPILLNNHEEAIRAFKMSARPDDITLKDLEMYQIGEFNIKTGEITAKYEHIIDGSIIALELQSKLMKQQEEELNVLQRKPATTNRASKKNK